MALENNHLEEFRRIKSQVDRQIPSITTVHESVQVQKPVYGNILAKDDKGQLILAEDADSEP